MSSAYTSNIYITSARLADGYVEGWLSSETATQATIGWKIVARQKSAALYGQYAQCFVDGGYVEDSEVAGYITSSSSSWKEVCSNSGYVTVNKTTSARSVSVAIATKVAPYNGYGSVTTDWYWATCYVDISAKTSYKVSYNANGGSGAPSAQTKWYGTALTLSSTKPTRTGYSFQGWGTTASDTSVNYAAGASYTSNASITLYAIWKANTYTVSYNANGGSGAPASQTKTYGVNLTLSSTKPTRTNYNFLGWATSSTGSVAYAAGATYSANSAVTLYAVWELAYWKPKITNLTATRCDSDGTANEYGTYAKITFNWELCQLIGTNTTATIAISWTGSSASVTGSGTSGTVSKVVGSGALSIESPYTFTVKVTDNTDNTSLDMTLPASSFAIDFKAGGTGVAFGKPADKDGFEVDWAANLNKSLTVGCEDGGHLTVKRNNDNPCFAFSNNAESTKAYAQMYDDGSGFKVGLGFGWANSLKIASSGALHLPAQVYLPNAKSIYGANTSGADRSLAMINSSNNTYFGNGSYANSEGSTYYQGSTVGIQSKGNIYMTSPTAGLSARAYGVNKVLHSSGYFMNASQTATLSEAVSAQPNGIILEWCEYNNGVLDSQFVYTFIPKHHVAMFNGYGVCCQVGHAEWGSSYTKYVYVFDTKITGNSANDQSNGIYSVLRRVIGV